MNLNSDVWCCIIRQLPINDWFNLSITCKNANTGLNKFMKIYYSNVNTYAHDIPLAIHMWRCSQQNNPPHNVYVPYPNAFEDPSSTLITFNNCQKREKREKCNDIFIADFNHIYIEDTIEESEVIYESREEEYSAGEDINPSY